MSEVEMVHHHRDVRGGAARAAVFGVSDGLVSNVGLILGVAAADVEAKTVLLVGLAGLLSGAVSMAAGEYASVKAEAELVQRELDIERNSLENHPEVEVRELASIYRHRGMPAARAHELAEAVMEDPEVALEVHALEELGIGPDAIGDPIAAATSSFGAFGVGAVVPLLPWFFTDGATAIGASIGLGLLAAAGVGYGLSRFTERSMARTVGRQVLIAVLACTVTWVLGSLLGASVA